MRYLPAAVIAELTPRAGTTTRRAKSFPARDLGRHRTVRAGVGHRDYFLCFAMRALWLDENPAGILAAVTGLRRV
jgi:hypothetical protein